MIIGKEEDHEFGVKWGAMGLYVAVEGWELYRYSALVLSSQKGKKPKKYKRYENGKSKTGKCFIYYIPFMID